MNKTHELKTWPEFFQPTLNGRKRFELRKNDRRNFKVGDELLLKEWNPHDKWCKIHFGAPCDCKDYIPLGYTGREVLVRVDYLIKVEDFVICGAILGIKAPDYVIMSVSLIL